MPKIQSQMIVSKHTTKALSLLAGLIRMERKLQKMSELELASRAGISRSTIQRLEKGDPSCSIGIAFEVASILGISLFSMDETDLSRMLNQTKEKIILLPKSIRKKEVLINDDF